MRKSLPLHLVFYLGILTMLVSILFRMQRWPGVANLYLVGFACHILFFVMMLVEVLRSKKADNNRKVFWSLPYAAILLSSFFLFPGFGAIAFIISGALYLFVGRKQFLYKKGVNEPIKFDSI